MGNVFGRLCDIKGSKLEGLGRREVHPLSWSGKPFVIGASL